MLVLHQLSYVLLMLWCTYYAFSRTNLLTRCHSVSSYFLLFLVSEKLHRKYSRNWTKQKPEVLFFPGPSRHPKRRRRGARAHPHKGLARPGARPRRPCVWGPRAPPPSGLRMFGSSPMKYDFRNLFRPIRRIFPVYHF